MSLVVFYFWKIWINAPSWMEDHNFCNFCWPFWQLCGQVFAHYFPFLGLYLLFKYPNWMTNDIIESSSNLSLLHFTFRYFFFKKFFLRPVFFSSTFSSQLLKVNKTRYSTVNWFGFWSASVTSFHCQKVVSSKMTSRDTGARLSVGS